MSRKLRAPNFRLLNRVLFAVVAVAVLSSVVLSLSAANSFSADMTTNILGPNPLAKYNLNNSITTLQNKNTQLQTKVDRYNQLVKNPWYDSLTGKLVSDRPNPSNLIYDSNTGATISKKEIATAKAQIKVNNEDIAAYKKTIRSIDPKTGKVGDDPYMTSFLKMINASDYTAAATSAIKKSQPTTTIAKLVKKPLSASAQAKLASANKKANALTKKIKADEILVAAGTKTKDQVMKEAKAAADDISVDISSAATAAGTKSDDFAKIIGAGGALSIFDPLTSGAIPDDLFNLPTANDSASLQLVETFLSPINPYGTSPTTTSANLSTANLNLSTLASKAQAGAQLMQNGSTAPIKDQIRATRDVRQYLASIPGMPALTGLDNRTYYNLTSQISEEALKLIDIEAQLKAFSIGGPSAGPTQDGQLIYKLEQAKKIEIAKIQEKYNRAKTLQNQNTNAKAEELHDVIGDESPDVWNAFHSFADSKDNWTNNLNISIQGGIEMYSYFGDPARVVAMWKTGKNIIYCPTITNADGTLKPIKTDWNNYNSKDKFTVANTGLTQAEVDKLNATEIVYLANEYDGKAVSPTIVTAASQATDPNAKTATPDPAVKAVPTIEQIDLEARTLAKMIAQWSTGASFDPIYQNILQNLKNHPELLAGLELAIGKNNLKELNALCTKMGIAPLNPYSTGITIDPATGHAVYTTTIKKIRGNDLVPYDIGYVSFDPLDKSVDARVPIAWGNQKITLYSDPRTGDVYAQLSKLPVNGKEIPLKQFGDGKLISIMSVTVSKDGHIGGSFKLFNRLFNYNPNSKAFEFQIYNKNGGTIWADSKGNMRGSVNFSKTENINNASLYFDRTGNIGLTYELKTGANANGTRATIAAVSINKNGEITGTLDVGKAIKGNKGPSIMVGFDKHGLNSVTFSLAKIGGNSFGLTVAKDGSLSFGGFVPIAGLPVPISVGQDDHGKAVLSWPGGSLRLQKADSRPLDAPAPTVDPDNPNSYLASPIYYRHSVKNGFKTTRVYQTPGVTIEKDEEIARGDIIFDEYNKLLKRNPSIAEFLNWYYYTGFNLIKYTRNPENQNRAFRESELKRWMENDIKNGPNTDVVPEMGRYGNQQEYAWIQAGKDALNAPTRPVAEWILTSNPFKAATIDQTAQNCGCEDGDTACGDVCTNNGTTTTDDDGYVDLDEAIDNFNDAVDAAAASDPLFQASLAD